MLCCDEVMRSLLLYLSVSLHVDTTYVSLKHRVVFLLSTQTFFQHCDMLLVVLVLFLQGFHLG